MTKTLIQINLFFLHQNQNMFLSNIGNQNIFLEKNHNPPPPFKLNGRSLKTTNPNEVPAERLLQNDKISTADQQINSAFNGFSHIYLPLSFIEVIKCTGEFLQHQRKFVNGIHCRWKKGEGPGMPTCDEFN